MLIFSRLKQHLVSNNILVAEQYGFRDGVSTENAIFSNTELIFKVWNNTELITGLFCDLTKSFDCVNHELLIQKLGYYGVKGSIWNWLESYLYNRKQRVVLQLINSTTFLYPIGKPLDMVFHKDLCWVHCCLMFTLMIFHAL
jgi:hypothetical protein